MWSTTVSTEGTHSVCQDEPKPKGKGRGRGRFKNWKKRNSESAEPDYLPLVRPIFDWSEVGDHFPQASPTMDYSLLAQLLQKKVQDVAPSLDEQSTVQSFCTKVVTVIENMILTGEGEQLLLEEVRLVGSHKKGTALTGSVTADVVVMFKDIPKESLIVELAYKVKSIIEAADKEQSDTNKSDRSKLILPQVEIELTGNSFDLINSDGAIVRIFTTSTGNVVYGSPPDNIKDFNAFSHALRMIRHTRWWEEHTSHLRRSLVRILKSMQSHVPGLAHLNVWYLELLCHCAVIPLNGGEPLSVVDGFRRLFQLLAAGLFLPGSIGLPDPCEESEDAIHENLTPEQCEEVTSNAQMILVLLQFGAYREILACDGAEPAKFSEPYTVGGLTLNVAPPAYDNSVAMTTLHTVQ